MKALLCVGCTDVVTPYAQPAQGWRRCQCGDSRVRWRSPDTGVLELASTRGPDGVRALGFANNFLTKAVQGRPYGSRDEVNEEWRLLHDDACGELGPEYLSSEYVRACWSVVIRVGETGDVLFLTEEAAGR